MTPDVFLKPHPSTIAHSERGSFANDALPTSDGLPQPYPKTLPTFLRTPTLLLIPILPNIILFQGVSFSNASLHNHFPNSALLGLKAFYLLPTTLSLFSIQTTSHLIGCGFFSKEPPSRKKSL